MVFSSKYKALEIPRCNLLTYLFSDEKRQHRHEPLWTDAANPSNSISKAQALSWIQRLAIGLDRLGVGEGKVILAFTPNHIYVPILYLAAAGSKRIFTGVNPTYTIDEVTHQIRSVDAALVFIHPSLLQTGLAAAGLAGVPTDRVYLFAETEVAPIQGVSDWRSITVEATEAATWEWDPLQGNNAVNTIAAINFSSGTSGVPKGVCITHHNLVANASQAIFSTFEVPLQPRSDPGREKWLAFLPLYHAYSQLWTINIACKKGIPVYIMQKFIYCDFLRYIQTFGITTLQLAPPVLIMLTKRSETSQYDISTLRHLICGGAPLSQDLQNEVSGRFRVVVSQGWGMSETTCVATMVPGLMHDTTGSVGDLLPNCEAKLVDEEGNEAQNEGQPGELCLRGPQVMLRYLNNDQATLESKSADGWLKSGDIAIVRDNRFWIIDRKKELIKVNGLQVAPAELESLLLQNRSVADVAVAGVSIRGEEFPRAYIVLQKRHGSMADAHLLQQFVADRVAKHKRLTGGIKFVDEIPKLASGKIIRKVIKEWAKADALQVEDLVRPRL
jgi:4-coumarate--CoA ligase